MNNLQNMIVVLAPSENDATLACEVLREAGFWAQPVADLSELCDRIQDTPGAIVIADEALLGEETERLQELLSAQESWSDLPIVLLASQAGLVASDFFSASGNICLLERPFSREALSRAVDVAIRARVKQYQIRDLIREQVRGAQLRDEFFASLSHELRTPMSVILGWIDVLRSGPVDPEILRTGLEILERNARVQKGLIDDLLDMSRIITGKMNFEMAATDITALLQTTVVGFQPEARAKKIELVLHSPESAAFITADAQRLMQAVGNLISNSIKFTSEGGRIEIMLTENDKNVEITVTDNGIGIDPSFLPAIFGRLNQEDMSARRKHGGLGLGLAITSHIVEGHSGKILATSEGKGKGTRVGVRLPKAEAKVLPTKLEDVSRRVPNSLKGVKVLAVDDSHDILNLLELFLGRVDAEVHSVDSAHSALKALEEFKPDVILSDIGMPNMDGYQLIRTIRRLSKEKGGEIPAVALTAYARDEERSNALRAGFQVHVSKPISKHELISAISQLAR